MISSIYTASYFQPEHWGPGKLVGVSLSTPNNIFLDIRTDKRFAPQPWLLEEWKRNNISKMSYRACYMDTMCVAFGSDKMKAIERGGLQACDCNPLDTFGLEDGSTLLCWEHYKEDDDWFCHRRILADLLRRNNIDVNER